LSSNETEGGGKDK